MAEEPRRSVRATKGQHTKMDLDQATPEPKKKSTKKSKKVEVEEEAEIIRCVCGARESPDGDDEPWIACDNCNVWQHNVCVGVPTYDEDIPKNYLCEECNPSFHKELLDALKNGVHLWDKRRKAYEKMKADEEKESKKKGKKKGKRISDPKSEVSHATNGKANTPSTPVPAEPKKEKKDTASKSSAAKRKVRDDSQDKESAKEPHSKARKVSTAHTAHTAPRQDTPASGLPVKIQDLETSRQGVATLIIKGLKQAIPIAIKHGIYTLRENDTVEAKAERLAIEIENAVYEADKAAYKNQGRVIGFNLKHNQELCNGLLTRSLTPQQLAVMTSDDMANKELKRETAEMKARSDKQSIMVSDDGPRVRRTHKGEEVIEGDNFAVANDNTMSTSRRRSMLDPNAEMASRSRENSPGDQVELPDDIGSYPSRDDIRSNVAPKQPLNIETKPGLPMRKPSGQADFDINKVFSNVPSQSPVNSHHPRTQSISNAPPANGPGVDPEIDRMLQDDDGNESPPYSPAEYSSDPEIVWRGTVVMDSIARFPAVSKHVAGVDISRTLAWTDVLQKELKVAGRIDREKANEYLCSLRYSPPTDVVVVNVTPTGETATAGFNELYDYFQSKNRYGVLANKGIGNIRDTYLVPVPPSPASLPDFIVNLEGHKIPEERSEPMVVIALVIRNESPSDVGRSFDGTTDAQSPSLMGHPQRQMSLGGAGPSMSPIAPQGPGTFATPPIPQQQFPSNDAQRKYEEEQRRLVDQREGEANALRILGTYSEAPTVAFLMPQAFQMREIEWEIIRSILEQDEKARSDLAHLSQVLEVRMSQDPRAQQSQ